MNRSIHQTYRNNFKTYKITKKGLSLEVKTANDYISYLVDYEDIAFDEVVRRLEPTRQEYLLLGSAALNALLLSGLAFTYIGWLWLNVVLTILMVGLLLLWTKSLLRLRKVKVLYGPQNIEFFYFPKQQEAVNSFIKLLKESRKKYLRGKYMHFDELDDEGVQKNTYMWLYREKIISRDELKDLNDEINNGRIIGGL